MYNMKQFKFKKWINKILIISWCLITIPILSTAGFFGGGSTILPSLNLSVLTSSPSESENQIYHADADTYDPASLGGTENYLYICPFK